MRLVATCVILASALLGSAHADGDSLQDVLGPREVAMGEALRGAATGATAIALNPAGLPLNRELVFEGGYGYRPTDAASLIDLSACDSTSNVPGCFYYDYAGSNPNLDGMSMHRAAHVVGSALAYTITPRVLLGSNVKYFHFSSDVMGEPKSSGFTWDLGTTLRLTDAINLGVVGYNLLGATSVDFPRAVGGGIAAHPLSILSLSFDARWRLVDGDHSARYGGGAELFLRTKSGKTGFPVRLGALRDNGLGTTYLSGGLGIATMKFAIDVAARRAISGVDETLYIASMLFFGPRLPAPSVTVE
jgi:hypothetical protein